MLNQWPQMKSDDLMSLLISAKKQMSLVTRKPVFALCEQQRRRSACASVQSDQHLCCSLP